MPSWPSSSATSLKRWWAGRLEDLLFPADHGEGEWLSAERKPGEVGQVESRLRRKDGTEVWFHAAISPLRNVEGQFAGILGLFTDITERRRADEALRLTDRQARLLADSMPHIVWTARADGTVDYFNGRWYEYTGMSPEESLKHLGWRLAVHSDDLGRLLNVRDSAVAEGHVFQADVRLRDREGAYRWHIVRSVPAIDESGRVVRRFGTATDIDDRMQAEEALRADEQRFRFLAESIPQMVWTACPDGSVDYSSPRFLEYLGVAREQVHGWAWMDLLHPDDRQRVVDAWRARAPRGDRVSSRVPASRRHRSVPLVPRPRAAPAGRRRPDRPLVRHLDRHRHAMASTAGDRAAQPRSSGPGR